MFIINSSKSISGAEISLRNLICTTLFSDFKVVVSNSRVIEKEKRIQHKYLNLIWFQRTLNPLKLFIYFLNLVSNSLKIATYVRKNKVKVICSNTIKSYPYALLSKLLTNKYLVLIVRDNIKKCWVNNLFLSRFCDKVICISKHIYAQVEVPDNKKVLVYSGIDVGKWRRNGEIKFEVKDKKSGSINDIAAINTNNCLVIAYVAQITRWKNHEDFIRMASIIFNKIKAVRFIVVGDDLSGREKEYKKELHDLVDQLGISSSFSFLGYQKDIHAIMNDIDILVHPAINEPFGRVLIEAMAMEIPLVAYNCGGPKEIVLDKETGFLTEPYKYHQLAEKTMVLINNTNLRKKMGNAGRQRVIEKFNMERYVKEMEEVFYYL